MAEAVGVAASGIAIGTLAAQVTKAVFKIKSFCDDLQDAPEDLRDLLEELDTAQELIATMENDRQQNPVSSLILDPTSTSRCLQLCKKGADKLKYLTDSLSLDIEAKTGLRRKKSAARIVLKKNKLDKYRDQLDRAVRLLMMSHLAYTRNLIQLQPDIIVAKLLQSRAPVGDRVSTYSEVHCQTEGQTQQARDPAVSAITTQISQYNAQSWAVSTLFGTIVYSNKQRPIARKRIASITSGEKERQEIILEYRGPSWLVNRAWRIQATRSRAGWTFCPRVYNDIPKDSLVFEVVQKGDVQALQGLFDNGEASLFDRESGRWTLLHVAVINSKYDVTKLLIELGADTNYSPPSRYTSVGNDGRLPLEFLGLGFVKSKNIAEMLNIAHLLLPLTETEIRPWSFAGNKETFLFWQSQHDSLYYDRPLEERFQTLASIVYESDYAFDPWVILFALDRDSVLPDSSINMTDAGGRTLVHLAASISARHLVFNFLIGPLGYTADFQEVLEILITAGPDLHKITVGGTTPLLDFISEFLWLYVRHVGLEYLDVEDLTGRTAEGVRFWLQALRKAGVNLGEYGRRECELLQEGLVNWSFWYYRERNVHMEILTYGPSSDDWDLHFELVKKEPYKSLEYQLPGAWIEEDQIEGSDAKETSQEKDAAENETFDTVSEDGGHDDEDGKDRSDE